MVKVGLVDDSIYDLEKLNISLSSEEDISIVFSTSDSEEAYQNIKKGQIDLLITDIEMPKLSGYELADLINSYALDIDVIFVTGFSGYAVHAFELNVLDYIMKPYSKERLLKGIRRRVQKNKLASDTKKLVIKTKTDIHFIDKKDIIFIERTGRSTTIVTVDDEYTVYTPLAELEEELSKKNFVRSHRGFIINIHFVKNFSLYTKKSYLVSFQNTKRTAMVTRANLERIQKEYF
ncbi:MAG TPA: LytTR family DNA-binding domain-containing protein [Bacillus sp. (in: firmicutes)]|uniref:LytR/AlgR family response regulator transcription factor n=1 Tax=Bacillus litorisediminis TaxID=2922713 RepID=UPI001FAD3AAB|nr:LytTR family DNA-binding domain-containing protein [Bacillus litorisediminis]HWO74519.1 LytTR family DNA-binding domain-containing protein [Bacillus sp. (in: firmicutes)]